MNHAPCRPFKVYYYDRFLQSSDPLEIRAFLNCTGILIMNALVSITFVDTVFIKVNCSQMIHYHNECIAGSFVCPEEKPLGMEDGRIPDDSLSASSTYGDRPDHSPVMARLNTNCEYCISNGNTSFVHCTYSVVFCWYSLLHSFDSTFVKQKAGKRSVPRMSTGNDHFVLDN